MRQQLNVDVWEENEMGSVVIIDFKKLRSPQNAIKYTSCSGQCLKVMLHQWLTWVLGALTIQLLKLLIWKFSHISDTKNNKFFCPIDSWLIVVILKVWMPKYWCLILTYWTVLIVARCMPNFCCPIYDFCNCGEFENQVLELCFPMVSPWLCSIFTLGDQNFLLHC